MLRAAAVWSLIFLASFSPSAAAAAPASQEAWVERLFSQIGSREAWAGAKGFHMVEIMEAGGLPQPAIREYWVSFERPRIMEKMLTNGINQLQALEGEGGWMAKDGQVSAWKPEEAAQWRGFWVGIPTRVFHLLAARDPAVELREIQPGRMDVFVDGKFAVWIATDAKGRPVAYGREDAHQGTHFLGKLRPYGDIKLWDRATEPGGNWTVEMIAYQLYSEPPGVSFAAPSDGRTDPDTSS